MKLYLIRHGTTILNKQGRASGHADVPLEEEGRTMARAAETALPSDITAIYSSDLIRCKETALILNATRSLPIVYDARLRERHFGSLEQTIIDEWDPKLRAQDIAQEYDYRPYGGESVDDVRARVRSFLDDLLAQDRDCVLGVTSGGIVRLMKHLYQGTSIDTIENCSVHEFSIS